ncbi:uncharacterized protein THITE_2112330 [Thermothielavioides terrestris NRRL 8126]|uniref:Uncharacterized protein n=1 Tax=Thermothielavioides terrestris (strain ATCC 38088 / NRRL 8126) TaxID=578455 RepID=G2QYK7_THETT|nr:uncharacterized protein THITE_2112330 [Thermothielavioides terrestris NRRL 8126]AEO65395.1 hypothetical protein THITE_2112330 [Thermothielavioides terrestris NRRL 8126]
MEGAHTQKGPKKMSHPHHPHHVVPKHESGYTDEAAEECHDLIDKAEEDAHLHDPNSMYSITDKPEPVHRMKGGLESAGAGAGAGVGAAGAGTGTGAGTSAETPRSTAEKMQETGKHIKSTIGEKVEHMKEKMGMKK